jgi:hypothetical protein
MQDISGWSLFVLSEILMHISYVERFLQIAGTRTETTEKGGEENEKAEVTVSSRQ